MSARILALVFLCIILSLLSYIVESQGAIPPSTPALTPFNEVVECPKRPDHCTIIGSMRDIAASEHRILGTGGNYRWFYAQTTAHCKHNPDPNMRLHTARCL